MEPTYNPVENTFIAARISIELKDRLDSYASMNDTTISQLIRKGLKNIIEASGASSPVGGWSVRQ